MIPICCKALLIIEQSYANYLLNIKKIALTFVKYRKLLKITKRSDNEDNENKAQNDESVKKLSSTPR